LHNSRMFETHSFVTTNQLLRQVSLSMSSSGLTQPEILMPESGKSTSSMDDVPYKVILEVLCAYYNNHGDLVLPRRYRIPRSKDFPIELHGVDLASKVYTMKWWLKNVQFRPERVCQLNEIGFVWERLQPEWNLILLALITYSSIYGHLKVPTSFVVPRVVNTNEDDENVSLTTSIWPKATWGLNLGSCVHRIRTRNDFLRGDSLFLRRKQLDGLGFVWDVSGHAYDKFQRVLSIFARIERNSSASTHHARMSRKCNILKIPTTFIVPSVPMDSHKFTVDHEWPKDLWGYQLGAKCLAVRHKGLYNIKKYPDRCYAMEELGFQWTGNATLGWLKVIHAAAIYSRMHDRKLDVPSNFVVPTPTSTLIPNEYSKDSSHDSGIWPWPEQLWGFPLGQRLKDVRLKGAYLKNLDSVSSRKAQLDDLGFVWNPPRGRRKKITIKDCKDYC